MKELAFSVERIADRRSKKICSFLLSAIRYPLSAKTHIFLFIICSLWFMAGSSFAQAERFFEVKAKKFSYTPNIIEVNKGDLLRLRLISEDVHHGFYLDGYGISTSAHPGQDGSLKFTADKPGRFYFRCSVTCGEFHPYMVGYLIVKPNFRFNMSAAAVILIGLGSLVIVFRKKEMSPAPSPNSTV